MTSWQRHPAGRTASAEADKAHDTGTVAEATATADAHGVRSNRHASDESDEGGEGVASGQLAT